MEIRNITEMLDNGKQVKVKLDTASADEWKKIGIMNACCKSNVVIVEEDEDIDLACYSLQQIAEASLDDTPEAIPLVHKYDALDDCVVLSKAGLRPDIILERATDHCFREMKRLADEQGILEKLS